MMSETESQDKTKGKDAMKLREEKERDFVGSLADFYRLVLGERAAGILLISLSLWTGIGHADDLKDPSKAPVTSLEEVVVTAAKDKPSGIEHLPQVEGAKIYSGKKTSVIDFESAPPIVNSNYRQTFSQTPSLILSEESTPLFSVGYRGLAPHRAQFTQVLKDGIPIHADMFGYPEAYYVPPLEVVDHIDFIHGGAALMYGPQPGGALNFVTKEPYDYSPLVLNEENSFGSHDFYSNYTSLSGTQGALGYYAYFHHRQSQGFREFNSQVEVYYGGSKFVIEQDPTSHWTVAFDLYHEKHGEPGGLTRFDFDEGSLKTTRPSDRFELNRYSTSLTWKKEISEADYLETKGYFIYYERLSWRQRGGGFGTLPTGSAASTNTIESQEFYTAGVDTRLRHNYSAFGSDEHVLTGGVLYHHTTSPRTDERGTTGDAEDGALRNDSDRDINYLSVFLENLFKFGRFSITPGIRLENIWQSIEEKVNVDKTAAGKALGDESIHDFVVLGGVGANYEITDEIDLYSNFSQGYRPKIFTQAVPTGASDIINSDLEEGRSWQVDLGLRGKPLPYLSWDVSVFYMEFDDQIGTIAVTGGSEFANVGDARHQGIEVGAELGLVGLLDDLWDAQNQKNIGEFKVFYSALFLDARFTGGITKDKIPQYAPNYVHKGGVQYQWRDRVELRLAGTFYDDQFGNDSNSASFFIPSYKVWDLTGEVFVYKDIVSIFGGINNLFDQRYFSRVRSEGIDPADGRNYYAGVKVKWG
jgi:Fe(3+) dicitrate transport protein